MAKAVNNQGQATALAARYAQGNPRFTIVTADAIVIRCATPQERANVKAHLHAATFDVDE